MTDSWTWLARDTARKLKPIRVQAVTYLNAKEAACRAFGFVVERVGRVECEVERVEVRVEIAEQKARTV